MGFCLSSSQVGLTSYKAPDWPIFKMMMSFPVGSLIHRILGKQLVAPQDLGFQYVETPRPASVSANLLTDITDTDISSSHAVHE